MSLDREHPTSPGVVWQKTVLWIKEHECSDSFLAYLNSAKPVAYKNNTLKVFVGSIFAREALEAHYDLINLALSAVARTKAYVKFVGVLPQKSGRGRRGYKDYISPKLTFDNFALFDDSVKALELAKGMLDGRMDTAFFYIHADVGMGSTHFLHAFGNMAKKRKIKAFYTSTDRFTADFMNAIRTKQIVEFRERYASVELLLFDEIHLLKGKPKTEELLCNVLTDYELYGGMMAASGETKAAELNLSDKLKTRVAFGTQVRFSELDRKNKLDLIEQLTEGFSGEPSISYKTKLADSSVIKSTRDLISALRLYELYGEKNSLERTINTQKEPALSPQKVAQTIAKELEISIDVIRSRRRTKEISFARGLIAYTLSEHVAIPTTKIADILSITHQSAKSARDKFADSLACNLQYKRRLEDVLEKIQS